MALDGALNVQIRDCLGPHPQLLHLRLAGALLHMPCSSSETITYPKRVGPEG